LPDSLASAQVVVASNHCTAFDIFPFLRLFKCNVLLDRGFYEANPVTRPFLKVLGAVPVTFGASSTQREATRRAIRQLLGVRPDDASADAPHTATGTGKLVFFPEG